jgi:type II secretory pathway component PulC
MNKSAALLLIFVCIGTAIVFFANTYSSDSSIELVDHGSVNYERSQTAASSKEPFGHAEEVSVNNNRDKANFDEIITDRRNDHLSIEQISLLGIFYSQQWDASRVELQIVDKKLRLGETAQIGKSSYYIKGIFRQFISLTHDGEEHELYLGESNSLEAMQRRYDYTQMVADEIGERPKLIEHIVSFDDSSNESAGKRVFKGVNPGLFRAARFKENDVLLSINDVSVDDDDALRVLEENIPVVETLVFEVLRDGRLIKLYLDIPSEALKIN